MSKFSLRKAGLVFFLPFFFINKAHSQPNPAANSLMEKLDSICRSNSVSCYFAGIYFKTTAGAIDFFSTDNEKLTQLIERLSIRFAYYFFRSAAAYKNKTDMPDEWKAYYADSTAFSVRYILFGINAHINGDIWQALTSGFSLEEIRELKPHYFLYYKRLLEDYEEIYASALASSSKMRFIHAASFGFDKWYGKVLLRRWRKRQMTLAQLFYTGHVLFEKKLKGSNKK